MAARPLAPIDVLDVRLALASLAAKLNLREELAKLFRIQASLGPNSAVSRCLSLELKFAWRDNNCLGAAILCRSK